MIGDPEILIEEVCLDFYHYINMGMSYPQAEAAVLKRMREA